MPHCQLLKIRFNQNQIAKIIGVHKSTISRELKRNSGKRGYRYNQAQRIAEKRKNKARKRITPEDWLGCRASPRSFCV
jgi:transposase, IS30 family